MKDFFKKYNILDCDKLIIACSGGTDSIFLAEKIISNFKKENIIIAHFNHNLRGVESERDQDFVRKYCENKGVTFELGSENITILSEKNKTGIEETARTARYIFLENIRIKYSAKFILTAHHKDDKIETFFFNLLRGAKLNGLTQLREQNNFIIRPLLDYSKKDILDYLKENKIDWIEDSSNADTKFLRNYLRLKVIPTFSQINPNYDKTIINTIEYFEKLDKFLTKEVEKYLKGDYFLLEEFLGAGEFLQKEIIAYTYKLRNSGTIGLSEANINEIIKFINDKGNHTKKEIKKLKLKKINQKIYY